jgi:phosphatidylglycerol:prolipoprotein diacylglycerol transferase
MHRIMFRIPLPFPPGHFDIASYGVLTAIGALFAVLTAVARAKRSGENMTNVLDLALWVLIAGLIGSRIFYLTSYMHWTGKSQSFFGVIKAFFQFRQGGLVFYGGLLLAIPVGIIYLVVKRLNVWRYADIAAPSVAIGIAFARIGCYLNGCCWGKHCSVNFPFHVAFPADSLAADYGEGGIPLYPTQFISSINAAILFVVFALFYPRKKFDGQVFWLFCAAYAVTRFLIEFLRGDSLHVVFGTFTISQGVSLLLFPASLIMYFVLRAKAKRAIATPR